MSQVPQPPPKFHTGQCVYLTAPLNPSAVSTWLFEGELDLSDTASTQTRAASEKQDMNSSRSESVHIKEETGPSVPLSDGPQSSVLPAKKEPLSHILTEKTVALIPHLPHMTNTIRHATAWKVNEVIPAESDDEEHRYFLAPIEPVKALVPESSMREAGVFVGTIVRKRNEQDGLWVVAGLSVSQGVVLADIFNGNDDIDVVRAEDLRMLPIAEALRAMTG